MNVLLLFFVGVWEIQTVEGRGDEGQVRGPLGNRLFLVLKDGLFNRFYPLNCLRDFAAGERFRLLKSLPFFLLSHHVEITVVNLARHLL